MNASQKMAVTALVALAGCANIPTAPMIAIKPGAAKSAEQFNTDHDQCRALAESEARNAARHLHKPIDAPAVSDNNMPEFAPGHGRVEGESGVQYGGDQAQRRYDISYARCMYEKGNIVPEIR